MFGNPVGFDPVKDIDSDNDNEAQENKPINLDLPLQKPIANQNVSKTLQAQH